MITDLLSEQAIQDSYGVYAQLRAEGPVVWLPEHHAWFISTYDAVHDAFRDQANLSADRLTPLETRLSNEARAILGDTFDLLRGWMVFHDPPHHERLKGPVRRAFTPKAVENLRPHVEEVVDRCLDEMAEQISQHGQTDLVAQLAFPLPAIVIAELLGVPTEDRDEFKTWSNQLAAIVFGTSNKSAQAETAAAGTARFAEYFTELITHYERNPGDNLISDLISARDVADPPLSATELVGACTLLLFGGHETTTNLIANGARSLLDHPDQQAWLAKNLGEIGHSIEELHRYDGPTKVMVRVAATDHERGGMKITAGQTVFLGVGSANRDPQRFNNPESLELTRPDAIQHLGFGYGLHFCLGAPLARLEGQIAISRLLQRFPDLRYAVDPSTIRYSGTILGRSPMSLPVTSDLVD
jgi:cytochrome P450